MMSGKYKQNTILSLSVASEHARVCGGGEGGSNLGGGGEAL